MKICKRLVALLLLLLLLLLPTAVSAAGAIDQSKPVSLTVRAFWDKEPVSQLTIGAYLVATVDECGELTVTDTFQPYATGLDIRGKNDSAWWEMAERLEWEILLHPEITPLDWQTTDDKGIALFDTLPRGLYLMVPYGVEKGNYVFQASAFFAMLPQQDKTTNSWIYHVSANAKMDRLDRTADYEVVKIWKDECHKDQRPKSITIQLLRDGEPYLEPVTLPENGVWKHTWYGLETKYQYSVQEVQCEGYGKPDITREGTTFVVVNSCNKPGSTTSDGKLPQTGQLWWPVPILLCVGLACVVVGLVRRRRDEDET